MDRVPEPFLPREDDVRRLVTDHPLAWVVTESLDPVLMPVRPVLDADGELTALSGHFPRGRSIVADLRRRNVASFLFSGPSAYVSPSWYQNRKQAPTWASASVTLRCEVELLDDDPHAMREALRDLVDAMEEGRDEPWSLDELGERYDLLTPHIVPFRATITDSRAAFRLCQDEDETTFADLVDGLRAEGQDAIAERMLRARGVTAGG